MVGTNHLFTTIYTEVYSCATLEVITAIAAASLIIQRHIGHILGSSRF